MNARERVCSGEKRLNVLLTNLIIATTRALITVRVSRTPRTQRGEGEECRGLGMNVFTQYEDRQKFQGGRGRWATDESAVFVHIEVQTAYVRRAGNRILPPYKKTECKTITVWMESRLHCVFARVTQRSKIEREQIDFSLSNERNSVEITRTPSAVYLFVTYGARERHSRSATRAHNKPDSKHLTKTKMYIVSILLYHLSYYYKESSYPANRIQVLHQ